MFRSNKNKVRLIKVALSDYCLCFVVVAPIQIIIKEELLLAPLHGVCHLVAHGKVVACSQGRCWKRLALANSKH